MYYEVQVVFIEEIQTKNGVREKKVRENYLVECDAVSVAEAKVMEYLKDAAFTYNVVGVKESKSVEVIELETKV